MHGQINVHIIGKTMKCLKTDAIFSGFRINGDGIFCWHGNISGEAVEGGEKKPA